MELNARSHILGGGEITYSINKNELRLTSRPGAMAEVFKIDGKKLSIEGDQLIVWVPPEYREFFGVRGRTTEVSWKSCYDELPPVLEGLNFWIDPIKSNL